VATQKNGTKQPFLTDIKELRNRARKQIEKGAVTSDYGLDPKQGIASEGPKDEFAQHAKEERGHMERIAERINQLGGTPNFDPKDLATRAASEYGSSDLDLVAMIKENLIAERIAIEHYRELIQFFGARDSTTRTMLEDILSNEEEHANDMHDLLVAHEGRPMLPRS